MTVGMSGSIDGSESRMLVLAPEAVDRAAGVSSSNGEYERVSLRVMAASARSDCDARIAVMSASSWHPPVPLNTLLAVGGTFSPRCLSPPNRRDSMV